MVLPFSILLPSKSKKQSHLTATNFLKRQKMEVTFDITKFYSFKISSDIILVKPHKTSQGKGGVPLTFAQPLFTESPTMWEPESYSPVQLLHKIKILKDSPVSTPANIQILKVRSLASRA